LGDTIIIKACLNGFRRRTDNPNIPYTPAEVAAEARRCYEAGASVVHIHARTPEGDSSYSPEWYAEADALIRSETDLLVNHTTLREPHIPLATVLTHLNETPAPVDMVSVNMGYGVEWIEDEHGQVVTDVEANSYDVLVELIDTCYRRGIFPEPAIQDTGMLNNVVTLQRRGILKQVNYLLVEFVAKWGDGVQAMPGTLRDYYFFRENIRMFYPDAICMVHGFAEDTFTITSLAVAAGDHIRVGFEDSPVLPDNANPASNADFVNWAVTLARLHGREPATPAEVRQRLSINLP